ncbi:MAG: hypothetical protein ACJ8EL_19485, partial [Rhizomicrobium sp.]
ALLTNTPYDCTVVARSTMRLLTLSGADFLQLTRKHPKLKRRFEAVVSRKGQKLDARARRPERNLEPEEELDLDDISAEAPADID